MMRCRSVNVMRTRYKILRITDIWKYEGKITSDNIQQINWFLLHLFSISQDVQKLLGESIFFWTLVQHYKPNQSFNKSRNRMMNVCGGHTRLTERHCTWPHPWWPLQASFHPPALQCWANLALLLTVSRPHSTGTKHPRNKWTGLELIDNSFELLNQICFYNSNIYHL